MHYGCHNALRLSKCITAVKMHYGQLWLRQFGFDTAAVYFGIPRIYFAEKYIQVHLKGVLLGLKLLAET